MLAMNTHNETSATRAADPLSVFIASTLHTSAGSVALSGLEKESASLESGSIPNPDLIPSTAEALTVPPVASWVESPMIICRWCGFMVKYGRGNVEHVDFCHLCKCEVACA